ncbi:MAG: PQQ-binding-like beta-propeller repeat protein [Theionarchaea archaeon]|nr:PQQ-binding-like beta-propeller repeat protein [Theionarchaea archaeon]
MMKCMLFAGMCILFIAQFNSEYKEEWPQLGHDTQHTFFSEISVPDHLEIVWQYQLEPPSKYPFREYFCSLSSPAVVGNKVYFLSHYGLHCLDLQTGRLLYEVPAYSIYPYTPAVADGRVYLAAKGDLFRCLDANTGKTLWEKELPYLHLVSPIVDDDTVYVTVNHSPSFHTDTSQCAWVATEWSTLLAMDKETGEEIWRYSLTDDSVDSAGIMRGVGFPILADETIFFYANYYKDEEGYDVNPKKSGLVRLDARTGTLKWKREGLLPSSSADRIGGLNPFWVVYYSNRIYIGSTGYVMCVDVETQESLWEYKDVPGWGLLSVGNGIVVVRSWTRVDCLDAETGEELWKISVNGSSMPVMTENEVFIGSDDKTLYRVDIKSGKITESYYLGDSVYSPVVAHGHVLVGTYGNQIYCLGPSKLHVLVICTVVLAAVFLSMIVLHKTRAKLYT